jgi:hypothetical protein
MRIAYACAACIVSTHSHAPGCCRAASSWSRGPSTAMQQHCASEHRQRGEGRHPKHRLAYQLLRGQRRRGASRSARCLHATNRAQSQWQAARRTHGADTRAASCLAPFPTPLSTRPRPYCRVHLARWLTSRGWKWFEGISKGPVIRNRTVSTPLKVLPEERMRFRNCWTFPFLHPKKNVQKFLSRPRV